MVHMVLVFIGNVGTLCSFSEKEGSYQIMCNNDDKSQDFFMNRLLKLF
jgi:hypothetical protein